MTAETGFLVQRALSASGPWTTITTRPANSTSYTDTGLTNGTEYFYRVIATNDEGNSAPSNVDSAIPAGAFDPLTIANCVLWLDADDLSTMGYNGTPITGTDNEDCSSWDDKSAGPGERAGAQNATVQFKYRTNVNGHHGLQLSASNTANINDSGGSPVVVVSGQECTIFGVAQTASSDTEICLLGTTSRTNGCVYLFLSTSAYPGGYNIRGAGACAFENTTAFRHNNFSTQDSNTSIRIATTRVGSIAGDWDIWRDGAGKSTISTPASSVYNAGVGAQTEIGEVDGRGDNPISGSLTTWHEILVYDRTLTDTEVNDVHDYLKTKWGI